MLQCVAVCCSVLQCVAVCCSVLQCVVPYHHYNHIIAPTGWQRPIGCLKLQVIFRKRAKKYRALLWKMTYKDKASYDSTPPCTYTTTILLRGAVTICQYCTPILCSQRTILYHNIVSQYCITILHHNIVLLYHNIV